MATYDTFLVDHSPRSIFGVGSHSRTGEVLKTFGSKKALVVYDSVIGSLGYADQVISTIEAANIEVIRFGEVAAEPTSDSVNAIGALGRKHHVDAVVGIGGGSTLDSAKGANLLLSNPGQLEDYIGVNRGVKPIVKTYPLILLPTTSGTSAEITPVFVVTESSTGKKTGATNRSDVAIIDPTFMLGLPAQVTASTGVDMLAHVTESFINPLPHWMTELLDLEAIRLSFQYLPIAAQDGTNLEARTKLAFSCMIAGYAMADKGTYLGHAVVDRITNRVHCPHGQACGAGLLVAIRYTMLNDPSRLSPIASAIGLSPQLTGPALGQAVYQAYRGLIRSLGLKSLCDFDLDEAYIQFMCNDFPKDVRWKRCPAPNFDLVKQAILAEWSDIPS